MPRFSKAGSTVSGPSMKARASAQPHRRELHRAHEKRTHARHKRERFPQGSPARGCDRPCVRSGRDRRALVQLFNRCRVARVCRFDGDGEFRHAPRASSAACGKSSEGRGAFHHWGGCGRPSRHSASRRRVAAVVPSGRASGEKNPHSAISRSGKRGADVDISAVQHHMIAPDSAAIEEHAEKARLCERLEIALLGEFHRHRLARGLACSMPPPGRCQPGT